ncbi:phytanoyl-CoA dioxygenase family protein [Chlorogloeopsis fritschii PCC 9212]|uniref:Phytanoyl-CoA dioxygenase n=1 Tax=Chlorogloeopsis fritschii PCC 6912 TaxID=211165 RepID=A0A433NQD8_CHLFR|nr:phytanoyl-CoA dioxygenase family protein [Chlorogloeopsis fritschii]RUR85999.1 hypothetical protein PCC6912_08240 [Chlorogloeopsis fritschii PCC 6912]
MLKGFRPRLQRKISQLSQIPSDFSYRVALLRYGKNLPKLAPKEQLIVDACKREGVYVTTLEDLGFTSTSQLLKAARNQLNIMEKILPQAFSPAFPQIFTVTDLPEFFSWAHEETILKIVENYIGLPIIFQGVHLRRDFANEKPITTELWHQDLEDRRILKIIVYLSDVSEDNGPFEYIPKHRITPLLTWQINSKVKKAHALGITDEQLEEIVPRIAWKSCLGSAGTVIFTDTKGVYHHGKSRKIERSALFFVYTSAQPLRPEHCTQYHDQTFSRLKQIPSFS